jgi:hypothetical protein
VVVETVDNDLDVSRASSPTLFAAWFWTGSDGDRPCSIVTSLVAGLALWVGGKVWCDGSCRLPAGGVGAAGTA